MHVSGAWRRSVLVGKEDRSSKRPTPPRLRKPSTAILPDWPAAALMSVQQSLDLGAGIEFISASSAVTYGTVRQRPRHYLR
jgi:hypothetical protein